MKTTSFQNTSGKSVVNKKILVVDDEASNRKILNNLLKTKNFDVLEAVDGKQAVHAFIDNAPDLVLMDIMMPEMNGHDAATNIKEIAGELYVPIIFVTALDSDQALKQALASGGDDFISKPVRFDVLEAKINAHLRIKALNDHLALKNRKLASYNIKTEREHEVTVNILNHVQQQNHLRENIKTYISGMDAFNGDILLIRDHPRGGYYVLLGDFTGHGLHAAICALPVEEIFFRLADLGSPIEEITSEINKLLSALFPVDMFFAATLIQVNEKHNKMTIWSGGLPETIITKAGGEITFVTKHHCPLGIIDADNFDAVPQSYELLPEDRVYIFTDGVSEMANEKGELFGTDRIENILNTTQENKFTKILAEVLKHKGAGPQKDDMSIVEISFNGENNRKTH